MVGGLTRGIEDTGATRRSVVIVRNVITCAFVALIVVVFRAAGVGGTALAAEASFGLAALIPAAAMRRPSAMFRQAAAQDALAPEMAPAWAVAVAD
jgi:hypothetical protein